MGCWEVDDDCTVQRNSCVYRLGMITGHSQTGVSQTDDMMCRMIKGFKLGSAPDLDLMVNMTPVDYVSSAIVHLSRQKESLGKLFTWSILTRCTWASWLTKSTRSVTKADCVWQVASKAAQYWYFSRKCFESSIISVYWNFWKTADLSRDVLTGVTVVRLPEHS